MKKRGIATIFITLLLWTTFVPLGSFVQAEDSDTFRILEIVDQSNSSVLAGQLSSRSYQITTMPMKMFVAQRDDIDGKYDAIYIADGTYSTAFPTLDPEPVNGGNWLTNTSRAQSHKTQTVMNDLTLLKAKELETYYINKGLPVVFDAKILLQTANAKQIQGRKNVLASTFLKYVNKSNVYSTTNVSQAVGIFKNLKIIRPHINVTASPSKYGSSGNTIYKAGDTVSFTFQVSSASSSTLTANLYMDSNFNNKFEAGERVYSSPASSIATSNGYTIQYKLPRGLSGVRIWKLEITDQQGFKDYQTGVFQFQGDKVDIHVLQVTSDGAGTTSLTGSLTDILKTMPGYKSTLNPTGIAYKAASIDTADYKITVDVVNKVNFETDSGKNDGMCSYNTTLKSYIPCYRDLNKGYYNMVVFGFNDGYGSMKLTNSAAITALNSFLATGQSVFMTHDTLRRDRTASSGTNYNLLQEPGQNNWFQYLMEPSGQTYEIGVMNDYATKTMADKLKTPGKYFLETNLGRGSVVTVTKTKRINEGLVTMYPNVLSANVPIATTHSQYFALNLEDPDVIPWYNIMVADSDSNANNDVLDSNDSYNHFYIYSRKNVTYTGAGHTSSGFTEEEKKLFVNTMYRAFSGANHAPFITVYSPAEADTVLSNQTINLAFQVEDVDAKDRTLQVKVYCNNALVYENNQAASGSVLTKAIEHSLPNGGQAVIRIEASDASGAKTTKEFTISVKHVDARVAVTRKLTDAAVVQVGKPVSIQYSIQPESINPSGLGTSSQQYVKVSGIRPLAVYESIVSNLKTGDPVVSIEDSNNQSVHKLVNAFVKPDIVQTLKFSNSVKNDMMQGHPNAVSVGDLNSGNGLIDSDANAYGLYKQALEDYINAVPGVVLTLPIYDETTESFTRFARFRVNEDSITFQGFVQDYSFSINNMVFKETFPKGLDVQVPDNGSFKKEVNTNGETIVTGNIGNVVYQKNASGVYEASGYSFSIKVTPQEKGQYSLDRSSVSFQGIDGQNQSLKFENLLVTAKNGLQSVSIPSPIEMNIDSDPQNVLLSYNPADAEEQGVIQSVKWSAEAGQTVISVDPDTGIITPLAPGTAKVSVSVQDIFGTIREATTIITVRQVVSSIEMIEELQMKVGDTKSLELVVTPANAKQTLEWQVGDSSIVTLDQNLENSPAKPNAQVTALKPGTTTVKVTGYDADKKPIVRETKITVTPYVSKLEVTPNTLVMKEGETVSANTHFQITIEPAELSNVPLKWALKTPNPLSPVTVSESGIFTANKPTTVPVIVTVTAQDGSSKTADISVTVTANNVPLTGISFSTPSKTISVGETFDLSSLLVFLPAAATNQRVSWSSNDSRFVAVNNSGVIQGKAKGYATITVVSEDGAKTASIVIYVTEQGGANLPNKGDAPLFRW